ncbi:putative entry exclusion protein TrbK-alt [Mesorhizobium humile]|uniref:Entry exclusion protein TrbK-alt n=1 Tax=Mesorhizobium humile TaxID=3072313 RepID=A0ABU4YLV4_9HYPH|nr:MULTISPECIES: putative entry exclusion protein TrbK-alt [unclassified Mesorhizobium]MDX8457880.1 putative entry exclusion protein TrbK-alt [Mesorhizobium sp. VK2D]MDX8487960.1 putative entry exclusion protein TrbK-alt [Mesorhizobium sp. VK2B]
MDFKIAARVTVVLALCAAMAATLMVLRGNGSQDASSPRSAHPGGEPSIAELARCRSIGMAAASDPDCRTAWAQNRRRFFGTDTPAMPAPERFGSPAPAAVSP